MIVFRQARREIALVLFQDNLLSFSGFHHLEILLNIENHHSHNFLLHYYKIDFTMSRIGLVLLCYLGIRTEEYSGYAKAL